MTAAALPAVPSRVRAAWMVPALVALVAAAIAWWAGAPYLVGVFHDDGVYALLAKSLATGHGFHYLQIPGLPAATHYPPLYPLALAVVWRLNPTFPENIAPMLGLNALCIGAAALGLQTLLRRWFGWGERLAAVGTLFSLLSIPILTLSSALMSEPLFLAGLMPVLMVAHTVLERSDRRSALIAGAAMGALVLVRTHAVALLGAVIIILMVRRDYRRALMVAIAAIVVQLPWLLWCRSATPYVPQPLRGTYGAYSDFFREGWQTGGVALFLATARTNLTELWLLLGDRVWGGLGWAAGTVAAVLLTMLGALGVWRSARRTPLLPTFLGLYLGIVVVMSCAIYRYVWGIWPLLVVLAILGAETLIHRAPPGWPRTLSIAVVALPFAAMARTELQGYRGREWEQPGRDATRPIAPLVEWIRRKTPSNAQVLVEAPEIVTLFTGREAAPPIPFTAQEYIAPLSATDHRRGLSAMLAAVPAQYVVTLSPGVRDAARSLPRLHPIDSLPGATMFEVRR